MRLGAGQRIAPLFAIAQYSTLGGRSRLYHTVGLVLPNGQHPFAFPSQTPR